MATTLTYIGETLIRRLAEGNTEGRTLMVISEQGLTNVGLRPHRA